MKKTTTKTFTLLLIAITFFNSLAQVSGMNVSGYVSNNVKSESDYVAIATNTNSVLAAVIDAPTISGSNIKIGIECEPYTINISGAKIFCPGSSTILDAGAGYSLYQWSNGASSQTITSSVIDTYTVIVTDINGCTGIGQVTTTVYLPPPCSITGSSTICYGISAQFCGPDEQANYIWSTGETTQCITVSLSGNYTLTVTDANGCHNTCDKTLTVYAPPPCAITGSLFYCQGSSTQLCTAASSSYLWSTGASTQCISATSGDYTVTVTNAFECSSSCNVTITERPSPVCSITSSGYACTGPKQLCAPPGALTYQWSNGAITQCIIDSLSGNFTVTITNQNGCSSSCSQTVILNSTPPCSITGNSSVCAGSSTQWCAPSEQANYLWSTGETTQCIPVFTSGIYRVTVTDANGCTSICSKPFLVNKAPACVISGSFSTCPGGTARICAKGNFSYSWSTGASSQCVQVPAGTYTLTNTGTNGCTSSCSVTITERPAPVCSITSTGSVCDGDTTQLCASDAPAGYNYKYQWSTGQTTKCIVTLTAGTYTVTVTDQYGCTSACNKTITFNSRPSCSITGNNSVCVGNSTLWCAPDEQAGYLWSTGETTQCISVSNPNTYYLTVTNANGCQSFCSRTLIVYSPATCNITGSLSYCQGGSTQICAASNSTYLWNTEATTQCINVTAGNYTVTVTNSIGCTNNCSVTVTERPNPVCSIINTGSGCIGSPMQLCAEPIPGSNIQSIIWSTGKISKCIKVTSSGTYTLTVTDRNGCTSNCNQTITFNPTPICSITGNSIICPGSSTQLCAPSEEAGYLWNNGSTKQCISVSSAGTYAVTVTNANGCTSNCSKTILSTVPACNITYTGILCTAFAQLCAGQAASYLWSTGASTQCIAVSTAGIYSVTVADINGCTGTCSKTISGPPVCNITVSGSLCTGNFVQLCETTPASSYQWSNGAHTQCILVNTAGTYTVTITDVNGCSSACTKTINAPPVCYMYVFGSLCTDNAVQICGSPGASSYLWSNGVTSQCINVNTAGTYTVTITDANGCSRSCSKTVNPPPLCNINSIGSLCTGNVQLCETTAASSYQWSNGATTPCILVTSPGTYTVTIIDINGCSSSCSKTIPGVPVCNITVSGTLCSGVAQLCASPAVTYLWSTGTISQCIIVSTAGTYTVTITDANGCTSTCSKTVNAPPACNISTTGSLCTSSFVFLCETTAASSYQWSTGATSACIFVTSPGTYTATITDINGCSSSCSKTISGPPVCNIAVTGTLCGGSNSQLCSAPAAYYLWNTGVNSQCINVSVPGIYTITITDANGCTSTCSKTISPPPACNITVTGNLCNGGNAQFCASPAASYLWSTGSTTSCNLVSTAGTYTVTISDANGCISTCSRSITVSPLPSCTISGNKVIPLRGTTQLCAPKSAANTYLWNTGATTRCIVVSTAGTYAVTVANNTGCQQTCTAVVTYVFGNRTNEELNNNDLINVSGSIEAQAYPNPFNSFTTIEFRRQGEKSRTTVVVFNVTGEKVMDLFDGEVDDGEMRSVNFDAHSLPEGIYIYRITSGNDVLNGRVILMKE